MKGLKGALIASAVASLFGAACASQSGAMMKSSKDGNMAASVKCAGVNACAGKGACASAKHSCKGHNACKGQGWLPTKSAAACAAQGGQVVASRR